MEENKDENKELNKAAEENTAEEKAEKKKKKPFWIVILCIALIGCIAGMTYICWYLFNQYTAGNEYTDIKPTTDATVKATEATEKSTVGDTPDAPPDNIAPSDAVNGGDINFDKLREINPDIYAWINIPNTMVNYPVAQYPGDDDSFYLSHNMYGEYSFAGCIYTEKCNKKDFSDPNTVLYGHNMLNGTMFRGLHDFRDKAFFDENPYIYITTADRVLTYEIFSAYEYDDRHLMYSFDFNNKEVFKKYLEYAANPTRAMMYNTRNIKVTADDKIITLSTCLGDVDTSRYLVQGVLINDEPR